MENLKASLSASIVSVLVFTPFDTVRTLISIQESPVKAQTLVKNIIKQQGFKGLYRGLGMSLMTTPLSTSLYFSLYEHLKNICSFQQYQSSKGLAQNEKKQGDLNKNNNNNDKSQKSLNLFEKASASILTGAIVNTLTNPLWLLKTKIQTSQSEQKPKIKVQIKDIYINNGIKGYYKGLGTSYLGLAHVGLYFSLYEEFKDQYCAHKQQQQNINNNQNKQQQQQDFVMDSKDIFITSSAAKIISIFATYPTTLLTTKLQSMGKGEQNQNFVGLVKKIYNQKGIKGFFQGMKIETVRALPANALTFMIYERVRVQKCTF